MPLSIFKESCTSCSLSLPLIFSCSPFFLLSLRLRFNQLGNLPGIHLALEDVVHGREERKVVLQALLLQEAVDLVRGARALQLLPIKHLLLDLEDGLSTLHGHLGAPEVAAAHARRHHVGHAARLLGEGRRVHAVREELLAEAHHLQDADAHHGRLGVVAPAEAVDEAGGERDNVLQGAAEGHAGHIVDDADVEVGPVEQLADVLVREGRVLVRQGFEFGRPLAGHGFAGRDEIYLRRHGRAFGGRGTGVHGRWVVRNRSLGVLFLSDLRCNVRSRKRTTIDVKAHANGFRHEPDALVADVHTLCAAYGASIGHDLAGQLLANSRDELMWENEYEDGGIFARVDEVGVRYDVGGDRDVG